jgi:hypothetical protein
MTESLSKRIRKSWIAIVVFVLIILGGIILTGTDAKPADVSEIEKLVSEFEKLAEKYNALVAELDAALGAYRASMPVFANFSDVVINRIIPVTIEGEKAATWLSDTYKRGLHKYNENSKYDIQIARKAAVDILAPMYKDVYDQFKNAIDANQLTLPNQQEEQYFVVSYGLLHNLAEPYSGSIIDHCPYEKGSVEYYLFFRDLGQTAVMATSPLGKMVYQIPPQLEKKQREVDQLYEELVQWKKLSKINVQLPPKYKEEYIRRLEAESKKLGRITELRRELKKIEDQGLNIIQLGVIDKAAVK